MRNIALIVSFSFLMGIAGVAGFQKSEALAQGTVFTEEELAEYNGQDGNKSYTSYEGVVYDVTDSKLWKLGEHFGLEAGKDLTADMAEAPHGDEVFAGFAVVGSINLDEGSADAAQNTEVAAKEAGESAGVTETPQDSGRKWWEGRIKILGISILGWTGIFMGIFFVLTFATCFAMPWAKLPVPWHGTKPGPDPLDASPRHMPWSSVHKHFVWWTVALGVIHGVLGFMQMLGFYL